VKRVGVVSPGWILVLALLSSCRGLATPSVVERVEPRMEFISGQVRDSRGDPLADGEVLVDNRRYETDESKWLILRIALDEEGRFVVPWHRGGIADFELSPLESIGAPTYLVLSVLADTTAIELTYPMVEQSWSVILPDAIEVNEGTINLRQRRSRTSGAPLYTDHFTLEMDSTRVMRGWVGPGLWSIRSDFRGPNDEQMSFDLADSARPDSSVFSRATAGLVVRPLSIVWPDSLTDDLGFRISAWGKDANDITRQVEAEQSWTRSTWPGVAVVPSGDYEIRLSLLGATVARSIGTSLSVYSEHGGPVVLYAGQYWIRIELSQQWPAGASADVTMGVGYWRPEAAVTESEPALFLVDEGSYRLVVTDSDGELLREEILNVDRNLRLTIDPPVASASK
jgi:hypothetical protein